MRAFCLIPNCHRKAPSDEAFCSWHRDDPGHEALYQQFKKRLMREVMVDVPGTSNYGRLVPTGSGDASD